MKRRLQCRSAVSRQHSHAAGSRMGPVCGPGPDGGISAKQNARSGFGGKLPREPSAFLLQYA